MRLSLSEKELVSEARKVAVEEAARIIDRRHKSFRNAFSAEACATAIRALAANEPSHPLKGGVSLEYAQQLADIAADYARIEKRFAPLVSQGAGELAEALPELDSWIANCEDYRKKHIDGERWSQSEYHRGAKEAYERVRAALKSSGRGQ